MIKSFSSLVGAAASLAAFAAAAQPTPPYKTCTQQANANCAALGYSLSSSGHASCFNYYYATCEGDDQGPPPSHFSAASPAKNSLLEQVRYSLTSKQIGRKTALIRPASQP